MIPCPGTLSNGPVDNTLYGHLGGSEAVRQVTAEFYRLALADELLAPLFSGVDMAKLAGMQAAFLTVAFGGPDGYQGRDLRAAHAALNLGDEHFGQVVKLLGKALEEAGASDEDITAAAAVAETVRGDVLGR